MHNPRRRMAGSLLAVCGLMVLMTVAACAVPVSAQTGLDAVKASSAETTFGDLVADAVRTTAGADFAVVPANEFKPVRLASAGLTSEELVDSLHAAQDPADTVVVMRLTGVQMRAALERGVSRAPEGYAGFLQLSGVRVSYDPSKPQGSRILTIVHPDGSPVAMGQTYTVATTHLLSDGALGYFEVWPKDVPVRNTETSLAKSLNDYVLDHQPLSYRVDGRVSAK